MRAIPPSTWPRARLPTLVETPRWSWRKRATTKSLQAQLRRDVEGAGDADPPDARWLRSGGRDPERRKTAPTIAAARQATARPSNAACRPTATGERRAERVPPRRRRAERPFCRMPRCRPRSSAPNHAMARGRCGVDPPPLHRPGPGGVMSLDNDEREAAQARPRPRSAARPLSQDVAIWCPATTSQSSVRTHRSHRRGDDADLSERARLELLFIAARSRATLGGSPSWLPARTRRRRTIVQRYLRGGARVAAHEACGSPRRSSALPVFAGNLQTTGSPCSFGCARNTPRSARRRCCRAGCGRAAPWRRLHGVHGGDPGRLSRSVEDDWIGDVDAGYEQMAGVEADTEPLAAPSASTISTSSSSERPIVPPAPAESFSTRSHVRSSQRSSTCSIAGTTRSRPTSETGA